MNPTKKKPAQARRTNSGAASPTQIPSSAPLGTLQAQESELASLRKAIVARLATHRDFRGVTIGGPEIAALAKARSVAKVHLIGAVHVPSAVPRGFDTAQPYFDPVKIVIRWVEDRRGNKSGKRVAWCAKRTAALLKNWTPGIPGAHPLKSLATPERLAFIAADPATPDKRALDGWELYFETRLDLAPAIVAQADAAIASIDGIAFGTDAAKDALRATLIKAPAVGTAIVAELQDRERFRLVILQQIERSRTMGITLKNIVPGCQMAGFKAECAEIEDEIASTLVSAGYVTATPSRAHVRYLATAEGRNYLLQHGLAA